MPVRIASQAAASSYHKAIKYPVYYIGIRKFVHLSKYVFKNIVVEIYFKILSFCFITVNIQTCRKFESFCGQNLDFQKFPQKCMVCDTQILFEAPDYFSYAKHWRRGVTKSIHQIWTGKIVRTLFWYFTWITEIMFNFRLKI
jgi:hypothetical protein